MKILEILIDGESLKVVEDEGGERKESNRKERTGQRQMCYVTIAITITMIVAIANHQAHSLLPILMVFHAHLDRIPLKCVSL